MTSYIERWLTGRRRNRVVSGCLLLILACGGQFGTVRLLWPTPDHVALDAAPKLAAVKARLLRLPSRQALDERQAKPGEQASPETFSALAFSQVHNATFVHWQPGVRGGELLLMPSWDRVPDLFAALTAWGVTVPAFSLAQTEAGLRLSLTLEPADEH